jgi:hypothetical protein
MIISVTQIITVIFAAIVIAKTLTDYKRKKENWQMFLFWLILWLGIVFVAFFPAIISKTIARFGDHKTTIGQIIGAGFVFILFVVYRVYVKAQRLEQQLNELVRKLALDDLKKGKK